VCDYASPPAFVGRDSKLQRERSQCGFIYLLALRDEDFIIYIIMTVREVMRRGYA